MTTVFSIWIMKRMLLVAILVLEIETIHKAMDQIQVFSIKRVDCRGDSGKDVFKSKMSICLKQPNLIK